MSYILDSENAPMLISLISVSVAIVSLIFAMYSWKQTHRPLISARITSVGGGNMGIPLNIVVENTGSRPAREVRLVVKKHDVFKALPQDSQQSIPRDAERCFFSEKIIPVLANGRSVSNAFGRLALQTGSWRPGASIPLTIKYRDLGNRRFTSKLLLVLSDDSGFAQTFWEEPSSKTS
ncbi:MAG: hypothetical protein Q8J70_01195 [Thiobacillus sp.]|nr:hypothetical protein [Thiobacillus sp.]